MESAKLQQGFIVTVSVAMVIALAGCQSMSKPIARKASSVEQVVSRWKMKPHQLAK